MRRDLNGIRLNPGAYGARVAEGDYVDFGTPGLSCDPLLRQDLRTRGAPSVIREDVLTDHDWI